MEQECLHVYTSNLSSPARNFDHQLSEEVYQGICIRECHVKLQKEKIIKTATIKLCSFKDVYINQVQLFMHVKQKLQRVARCTKAPARVGSGKALDHKGSIPAA